MGCAAPTTLVETLALEAMITMGADAEEFARFDLAHCLVMDNHGIRY